MIKNAMNTLKGKVVAAVQQAIGNANAAPIKFRHIGTTINEEDELIRYGFTVNGVLFKTGWHDNVDCDFLNDRDEVLTDKHDLNLLFWYLKQGDTVVNA